MTVSASTSAHDGTVPGYQQAKAGHVARLAKIEGQVRGVARMVERDRYCVDLLPQITAITPTGGAVSCGGEVFFEVARHFAGLASFDEDLRRFRIRAMMGPDEFHDGYPWTEAPGIDDNAYTNVLTAWALARAVELSRRLSCERREDVLGRLGISDADIARFDAVSRKLYVPFHDGVISQFAGYERLEPIDLGAYRARYHNIGRLGLILEAEGDTVRHHQVAKQADTLMLFYLFSPAELRDVFARLGYELTEECARRTISYYTARVTHGSTPSRVVHAWVAARFDRAASWRHLTEAFAADMADTQGGATTEGIHLGAMAGTIDLLQRCYSGLSALATMAHAAHHQRHHRGARDRRDQEIGSDHAGGDQCDGDY